MKTKNAYILFLFAETENQDEFVKMISNEIAMVAMTPDVRYYYGPQSSIFVFTSNETFNELSDLFKIMFDESEMSYVFLPFEKNNMSNGFSDVVNKHLFGSIPNNDKTTIIPNFRKKQDDFDCYPDEDDDDDLIKKLQSRPSKPTVNEILDKIRIKGMSSITIEEKTILDNYSKQL
jgi:hypothetical protein